MKGGGWQRKQSCLGILHSMKASHGSFDVEGGLLLPEGCGDLDSITQMPGVFDLMSGCIG